MKFSPFLPSALFLTLLLNVVQGQVVTINYPNFSSLPGLNLNGHTAQVNNGYDGGTVLRLARSETFSGGSVYSTTQINAADFSTRFQFRISNGGGITDGTEKGADGLAFVIQTVSSGLGSLGGGLGYIGVSPSVAIEFDTYQNGWDPSTNHLGLNLNGNATSTASVNVLGSGDRFDNLSLWTAWVDYDGTTLEVRANQTGIRPLTPLLSAMVDIENILGQETAYIGFAAATGSAYGNHDLVSWNYSSTFIQGGFPDIPEPSTVGLTALAGLGLFYLARRRRLLGSR